MTEESTKYSFPFQPDDKSYVVLLEWWRGLENKRGERAVLRRAKDSTEVIFSPAYQHLLNQLQHQGYKVHREALAVIAGLMSHVKDHVGNEPIAKQMATPKQGSESARVSGLRFRRLLAVTEREELYPMLVRIIHLLDGRVNLTSLANAVYWWSENTRKHWAYEYYATAPAEK